MDEDHNKDAVSEAKGATSPGPVSARPQAPSRVLRWLLVASLALNIVVLGLIVGAGIDRWRNGPRLGEVREVSFGPFNAALSPEDRDSLRQAFAERVGAGMRLRLEARADFRAFAQAVRAEPYDPAAVAAVLESMRGRNMERLQVGEDLLLERISAMDPTERAAFADRILKSARKGGRGHDDGRHGKP
ncbi:MAG: periplasmic heavy metal sensor [Paracoccaceae bacterium]